MSRISLQEKKPPKEAKTNSFSSQSSRGILSLNLWWRIFLLCSFQLVCAALLLETCSFRISLPTESLQVDQLEAVYFRSSFQQSGLQQEELAAAYCKKSSEQQSFQEDELAEAHSQSPTRASQLHSLEQMELCKRESFIHQLDLETSLSLPWFSLLRCSSSSFELRALLCAALLYKTRIRNRSAQSFQLTRVQLGSLAQGGVQQKASPQPTLQTRTLTALTLSSLSLAINAWLKTASFRACRGRPLRRSLCTTSLPTTSFSKAASTTACPTTPFRTTSSLRRTFLWFSFLFSIFFSNSFRGKELVEHNELLQTVLELELEELLADKPCPLGSFHDHLGQENFWSLQLQQLSLEKNKKKQQKQLSAPARQRTFPTSSSPAFSTRSRFSNQQTASRGTLVYSESSDSSLASSNSDRQP